MSTISVTCDCGKRLSVPAEKAGKRIRCPSCQQPVQVPHNDPNVWKPAKPKTVDPVQEPATEQPAELTPMQWVTISGAIVLVLSIAFFFVKPSGQAWRYVGLVGLATIAVPHHREIWSRVKSGAIRLTQRKERDPVAFEEPERQTGRTVSTQAERRQQVIIVEGRSQGGCLAAFLTLFIPGLGHMISGRIGAGILWFLACTIGGFILIPTIVGPFLLYFVCILDAASGGNSGRTTVIVT